MKTAAELRDELYEMGVLAGRLTKYSKKELETLIDGVKDQSSRIGEEVRRMTSEHYQQEQTGTIIRIEGDRGQVQWSDKKTWYKLDKLTPASTTAIKKIEKMQTKTQFVPSAHVLMKPNHKTFNTTEIVMCGNTCVFYIEKCTEGEIQAGLDPEGFYWATWTEKSHPKLACCNYGHPTLDGALAALDYDMACLYTNDSPWCADATGF